MSTVKSKQYQIGNDASASNNFTIYQPPTPDGTLRIGVGNADSPTEVARVTSSGLADANGVQLTNTPMFKASLSANQTGVSDGVNTKVAWNATDIDTHSAFDSTTNYRFTVPTGHAGKYFIGCRLRVDGGALNTLIVGLIRLRVNGVDREYCNFDFNNNYARASNGELTTILDLAEGDYIEIYGYANTSGGDATFIAAYHSILYGYKLIA